MDIHKNEATWKTTGYEYVDTLFSAQCISYTKYIQKYTLCISMCIIYTSTSSRQQNHDTWTECLVKPKVYIYWGSGQKLCQQPVVN